MLQLSIGVSALQASQRALEITGNNITNANTPGYHRQVVQLSSVAPVQLDGLALGRGVQVSGVRRLMNDNLEKGLLEQAAVTGSTQEQQTAMNRLESRIGDAQASPGARLETLFNQLEQLSSRLNDSATRRIVVGSADRMAREFNSLSIDIFHQSEGLDQSLDEVVREIGPLAKQIAQLNVEISRMTAQGIEPNDLLDQRTQAIQSLGERLDITIQPGNQGQVTVMASGVPLVISNQSQEMALHLDDQDRITVRMANSDVDLNITGGRLGGLLKARNETLPGYRQRIDDLAREVIRSFNEVQSTGVGVAGAFTTLNSQQPVVLASAKLSSASLPFPPKSGSLFIAVNNAATGERQITEVPIEPTLQSLSDLAASLTAVPQMQAFVNTQSGTMSLFSAPGYTFDFRGGFDEQPTTSFVGGTNLTAKLSGSFNERTNDRYTFTFMGTGTIGVTPGLRLQVTNQHGDTITTLDVGQGYEAGKPLEVAHGLSVTLSSGPAVSGDSFSSRVIGQPDTAGILNSLGLNTFFVGEDAATMRVNNELMMNSDRLATSHNGQPGDSTNLQRLVTLRDTPRLLNQSVTMSEFFNQTVADVGTELLNLNDLHDTNQLLTDRLSAELQAVTGVDPNEEMVNLLKYQRMFQIAAKYINAVNESLDQLLAIR